MKRQRETQDSENTTNCLIITDTSASIFECKTCNRKFLSFQALGGHRASHNHKRHKVDGAEQLRAGAKSLTKMYNCSICGQEFSLGQALGGHMRRHTAATNQLFSSINKVVAKVSLLKRSSSCDSDTKHFSFDLNLTPLENDFKLLLFGNVTSNINLSSF
ncbi:Zinc finger C2H2-type [Sesbania bispinosa]|nr:Zinc finger C2H2-type [Sesbania bispinosa]